MVWLSEIFLITKELAEKLDSFEEETGKSSSDLIKELLEKYFDIK